MGFHCHHVEYVEISRAIDHRALLTSIPVYNFSFSATNGPLSCKFSRLTSRVRSCADGVLKGVVPAEVFDTRTRAKGVSIGVMVR